MFEMNIYHLHGLFAGFQHSRVVKFWAWSSQLKEVYKEVFIIKQIGFIKKILIPWFRKKQIVPKSTPTTIVWMYTAIVRAVRIDDKSDYEKFSTAGWLNCFCHSRNIFFDNFRQAKNINEQICINSNTRVNF